MSRIEFQIEIVLRSAKLLILSGYAVFILLLPLWTDTPFVLTVLSGCFVLIFVKSYPFLQARTRLWQLKRRSNLLPENSHLLQLSEIDLSQQDHETIQKKIIATGEEILAGIDQDGFLLRRYQNNLYGQETDKHSFCPRKKYRISIVALNIGIVIKKEFCGNSIGFANELNSLYRIRTQGYVPSILKVDFRKYILYISYIPGPTVRQLLTVAGAKLLDTDTVSGRNPVEQWHNRIQEGKQYLPKVISPSITLRICEQIADIHRCGVCLYDIKYGNIIIDSRTQSPYLIDFEDSISFKRKTGWFYQKAMEYDRYLFNLHFAVESSNLAS